MKVKLKVCPVVRLPEFHTAVVLVEVCGAEPLLVQVTVSPTLIVVVPEGENAKLTILIFTVVRASDDGVIGDSGTPRIGKPQKTSV